MALNIDTQDIDAYPGTVKRVTVDQDQIVPTGFEGDEQFVITIGTSAYSENVARVAIADLYVTDFIAGWCKSSGFAGNGGKYTLDNTHKTLRVKMDATLSGSDGSSYYPITLEFGAAALTGEQIAEDMETKIRAITCVAADTGHQLAYTNASVAYTNGKFWIVSGSIGRYYTGTYRSSVVVASGLTNSCYETLGFDLNLNSQTMAGITVPESIVTSGYTVEDAALAIQTGTGVSGGDAVMITDGTNIDYFTALSGTTATSIVVATTSTNGEVGITNDYAADVSKVQILRQQDPDVQAKSWFSNVDELIRYGIKSIVNQIDYSS